MFLRTSLVKNLETKWHCLSNTHAAANSDSQTNHDHGRLYSRTRPWKTRPRRRCTLPFSLLFTRDDDDDPQHPLQILSFILSPFAAPAYNLPIFLFGTLVHESSDAPQSLKLVRCPHVPLCPYSQLKLLPQFCGTLTASILFDIIWVFRHEQNTLSRILLFLLWLLKARTPSAWMEPRPLTQPTQLPTAATFLAALHQRGSQFMGLGADVSGPTGTSLSLLPSLPPY